MVLTRLFKIYQGEGTKVGLFILLGALLQSGVALGTALADTLFLTRVGADKLPHVYIMMPIIMIIFTPAYSYWITKYGIEKLFTATQIVLIIGGLGFATLGIMGIDHPALFYGLKLYCFVWMLALYTLFWNYIDGYFDILDAKRLFALFSGGLSLGASIGGGLVTIFSSYSSVISLMGLWAVVSIVALPVAFLIQKKYRRIDVEEEPVEKSFIEQTKDIFSTFKSSRYITLLNVMLFVTIFITTLCEFQYMDIFSRSASENELAALFGKLFLFVNAANLFINFFLFNRMITIVGVRNIALLQPIMYFIAFAYLLIDPTYGAAVFGFIAYQGVQVSLDNNNYNFLFNAVPSSVKKQVRTFAEGLADPLATAVAGLVLFSLAGIWAPSDLSTFGLGCAGVSILIVLVLRHDYVLAMIGTLKGEWLDFSRSQEAILSQSKQSDIHFLKHRVSHSETDEKIRALEMLWMSDPKSAFDITLALLPELPDEKLGNIYNSLAMILESNDHEVFRKIILWKHGQSLNSGMIRELGIRGLLPSATLAGLLDSGNVEEKGAAALSLWHSWKPEDGFRALGKIQDMLEGSKKEREVAIRLLGGTGQERFAHFVESYLSHHDGEIRKAALYSMCRLSGPQSGRLIPKLLSAIQAGDSDERLLGLEALAAIGEESCISPLLKSSDTFSPQEKRRAERLLEDIGLVGVPAIISVLRDTSVAYAGRSIAARALGKLSFPQFEALYPKIVSDEIQQAYEFLSYHKTLEEQDNKRNIAGPQLLSRFYRDYQQTILDFVLELLMIGGRLPDFELIVTSLRSKNPKIRGNTIETLEQGVSRNIFTQLLPLVDGRSLKDKIRFYQSHYKKRPESFDGILMYAIESPFPIESSAAALCLYETKVNEENPELQEALLKRLGSTYDSLFRETALDLLAGENQELSTLNKVYHFSQSDYFGHIMLADLLALSSKAVQANFSDGDLIFDEGQVAESLYLIVKGEIEVGGENFGAGHVVGEGALLGEKTRKFRATSKGVSTLMLPVSLVLAEARMKPRMAISLLEHRMGQNNAA